MSILEPYRGDNVPAIAVANSDGLLNLNMGYRNGIIDALGDLPVLAAVTQLIHLAVADSNHREDRGDDWLRPSADQYARAAQYVVAYLQLNPDDVTLRILPLPGAVSLGGRHGADLVEAVEERWATTLVAPEIVELSDEEFAVTIELVRQGRGLRKAARTARALCS